MHEVGAGSKFRELVEEVGEVGWHDVTLVEPGYDEAMGARELLVVISAQAMLTCVRSITILRMNRRYKRVYEEHKWERNLPHLNERCVEGSARDEQR